MRSLRLFARLVPFVLRQLTRRPMRSLLTGAGVALATLLFVAVRAIDAGVSNATEATAKDTRLIVYRANRFCPFTSQLPQHYVDRMRRIDGVVSTIPIRIVVNSCRASLDVVTFRGVPDAEFERFVLPGLRLQSGSLDEWLRRSDAAMVGTALATRRDLRVGDRFNAAGVDAYVAGIIDSDEAQNRNVAFVHLSFLQEATRVASSDSGTGGFVTQFTVTVRDPEALTRVAEAIDAEFARDPAPTSTRAEKAFVARAAADIVEVSRFAQWFGIGALFAVFALVANAIALGMHDRVRDIAILQTLGFQPRVVTGLVIMEGVLLGVTGGAIGALGAWAVLRAFQFNLTTEGVGVEFPASLSVALFGWCIAAAIGGCASLLPAIRAGQREIVSSFRAV
ncbi:MAG: FtsX-like permease family protein [Phycisphaerae bacterium]|nr:FtsX-like permease family protein [Phycisphaerae bacterium]